MAWCRQAKRHYMKQCWPRFVSSYGNTRPTIKVFVGSWLSCDCMWWHRSGSALAQVCWFISKVLWHFFRSISQSIDKNTLKVDYLKFHLNLTGAKELRMKYTWSMCHWRYFIFEVARTFWRWEISYIEMYGIPAKCFVFLPKLAPLIWKLIVYKKKKNTRWLVMTCKLFHIWYTWLVVRSCLIFIAAASSSINTPCLSVCPSVTLC